MVRQRAGWAATVAACALLALGFPAQPAARLGTPDVVAPGVALFHINDTGLLDPPGPVAVHLLRLDPRRVRLATVLAGDQVLGTETVPSMASRTGAVAAVNGGFFLPSGEPAGLMKIRGILVSDASLQRGAVAMAARGGGVALTFDQVSASVAIQVRTDAGSFSVPAATVNGGRARSQVAWFNHLFNRDTDTTDAGTDWIVAGSPPVVLERRADAIRTVIPRDGAVLSFGGGAPAAPLDRLDAGDPVRATTVYRTARGTDPAVWERAPDAIGGAGLLMCRGKPIRDWTIEGLRAGFATERHPRTLIGVDGSGRIWLVAVDGRNPQLSLGMTFAELQGLAHTLRLRDALNLDGGGSTTMVVRNAVVNHPSDAGGPRRASDAILVLAGTFDGLQFYLVCLLYAAARCAVDFTRHYGPGERLGSLSHNQVVCTVLFVVVGALIVKNLRLLKRRQRPVEVRSRDTRPAEPAGTID